jgi:gluconolactonase
VRERLAGVQPEVDLSTITVVAGFHGAESLVVAADGSVYGGGHDGVIRRLTPEGRIERFAVTGGRPLGLAFDRDGLLVVCDLQAEAVLLVTPAGEVRVLAEEAGGARVGFPNSPVFDRQGNLYVSNSFGQSLTAMAEAAGGGDDLTEHDRLVRIPNEVMAREAADGAPSGSIVVFRSDGGSEVVAEGLYCPNGIAIDPHERGLYVLQSTTMTCVRIPLHPGGGEPEVVAEFESAPDGLAFDDGGNLLVTLPLLNRIVLVDPAGRQALLVDDPDRRCLDLPTGCAFAGPELRDLFVGHVLADHVARIPLARTGHRLFHLR